MKQWKSKPLFEKILIVLLATAILGAIGFIIYTFVQPQTRETFTEFYILGANGKAGEYPRELRANETGQVTVGVVNHEGVEANYHIEIKINGVTVAKKEPIVLKNSEKWEQLVSFTPANPGGNEKVEFFLYRDNNTNPYLKPLVLWLNVSP